MVSHFIGPDSSNKFFEEDVNLANNSKVSRKFENWNTC